MTRYALISVSDKTGIEGFAGSLIEAGFTLLSTGGTASTLQAAGLPVIKVSNFTGTPEIMGGRVKTLHPKIHGGILGDRETHQIEATEQGISWIDIVVVNLYPFERTTAASDDEAAAIENIDIGGPTMVRAAAKNHRHVLIVVDPNDYNRVATAVRHEIMPSLRRELATKAFQHTARYDAVIADWFAQSSSWEEEKTFGLRHIQSLRYGENPHQQAAFYADSQVSGRSLARIKQHQGKELSFNNLADADAALRLVFDYDSPACAIIKHMNPCGAATASSPAHAFEQALAADPVSAYGGILVFNRPLDENDVDAIKRSKVFFEVVAAPGYSAKALSEFATRENLRVLELPSDWSMSQPPGRDARRVQGGWLIQDWDLGAPIDWKVVTKKSPTKEEGSALNFAWIASRHVKSNAIVLARVMPEGAVLNGVGAGQMSRVDSVRLAISKATAPVAGSVLASDAFFPFPDGVIAAAEAGITAIIQPGGSIRDPEVIAAADAAGIAMVFTGIRHFRH